jgi:hypothetical protein
MSAPKRSAPGREIAGAAAKLRVAQPCAACPHSATLIQRLPEGEFHYAAKRCAACRAFIDWVAKPSNLARRRFDAARVARLAMCSSLSAWERSFVRSVSQQRKLSPRQQALVEWLYVQHLEGAS